MTARKSNVHNTLTLRGERSPVVDKHCVGRLSGNRTAPIVVASVLSKKAAAGSSHVVIEIPVGLTAKLRTRESADELEAMMEAVAGPFGLELTVMHTDGRQPVGSKYLS